VKLHAYEAFQSGNGITLDVVAGCRGVAIHPSSEVDICRVGAFILGVGSIVPPASNATPLRKDIGAGEFSAPHTDVPGAGTQTDVGGRLVLQYYEACDPLVPPAARTPGVYSRIVPAASILAGSYIIGLRVPFAGRREASIHFMRSTNAADLTLLVRGVKYPLVEQVDTTVALGSFTGLLTENAATTWWNGAGAAPTSALGGFLAARTQYVGGGADSQEDFDELQLLIKGAAGGDAYLRVETFGERVL
jgi:hypothetical protein